MWFFGPVLGKDERPTFPSKDFAIAPAASGTIRTKCGFEERRNETRLETQFSLPIFFLPLA
jgi:hypothetical protein